MITPDAFRVSPDLLGLPLASPGRRMAAILLDLLCIGILTVVTRSFALVFGIVVAAILVRVGVRRAWAKASVSDRAWGVSIGCLGLVVGLATVGLGTAVLLERGGTAGDAGNLVLEAGLTSDVVSDTLLALEARIADLENQLDDASSGGVLRRLTGLVDELGFGFGWAALYMTVLLSVTKGQTLGKRLLGIRVLRLDGQPINWWVAFERAGGYAAGFATGLLGFAQIYWDPNRQAIHDRIVGTVVVRDGAEKFRDWESTL